MLYFKTLLMTLRNPSSSDKIMMSKRSKSKVNSNHAKHSTSPTKGHIVSGMSEYMAVVRQRDELRIRIQHLLHLLNDSQTSFDETLKENQVLRHALTQESQTTGSDKQNPPKVIKETEPDSCTDATVC